jgi:carboxypeptidase C (cathepsin A)
VQRDADVIAKLIALYVAKNSRGSSQKYLLGESYGGFRAAKVARELQNDQGIVVSGIIMVSPMLEAAFQWGGETALRAALHFPALAATELERNKAFTPEAMAEAERFAMTEYLTTLAGPRPPGEATDRFYGRIAKVTGLPVETVAKTRGYVRGAYLQHLRANGRAVSSYDGSFAVPDPYPESASGRGSDPMLDGFSRALSGAFVGYARDELGFKTDMTYVLLAGDISSKWDWGDRRSPPGVSDDIRNLLALNPSFRLLVAHGYTDLVTPYGVSRYVLDQIPDIGGAGRTQIKLYRGGHMYYFDAASRQAFSADARDFIQRGP